MAVTDAQITRELAAALAEWIEPLEQQIALVRDWQRAYDEGDEPDSPGPPPLRLVS